MAAMYAFDFVLANFGIAIAARIPMITTTIRSSMRVNPRRVVRMLAFDCEWTRRAGGRVRAFRNGGDYFVRPPECTDGARSARRVANRRAYHALVTASSLQHLTGREPLHHNSAGLTMQLV